MTRLLLLCALLLGSAGAHAATLIWDDTHRPARSDGEFQMIGNGCDQEVGAQHGTPSAAYKACMGRHGYRFKRLKPSARTPGVVTFDRDSKDPNVGWHWENGMRSCSHDCDNPEIPGSGYTCTYHDGWRECVK